MKGLDRRPMRRASECRVAFVAIGTRGDVQPLGVLANSLKERRPAWVVTLITHKAHESWLGEVLLEDITCTFISAPPARRWLATGDLDVQFDTGEHRDECVTSLESTLDLTLEEAPSKGKTASGRLIVFNLFALEAYHFAEAMGTACICVALQMVPYKPPPGLVSELRDLMATSESKLTMDEISHWMWPLFTERWGAWREHRLKLDVFPDKPCMLLYGFSSYILPTPGWLPPSIRVCGFWTDSIRHCDDGIGNSSLAAWLERSGKRLLCVDFGSLGSLGFLKSPARLMRIVASATKSLDWYDSPLDQKIIAPVKPSTKHYAFATHLASCKCHSPTVTSFVCNRLLRRCMFLTGGFEPLVLAHIELAEHLRESVFLVETSLPHVAFFDKCDSILHHGGAGTMASSLLAGTPQIISPAHYDQFVWAERLQYMGVGCKPFEGPELFADERNSGAEEAIVISKLQKSMSKCLGEAMISSCRDAAQALAKEDAVGAAMECFVQAMDG